MFDSQISRGSRFSSEPAWTLSRNVSIWMLRERASNALKAGRVRASFSINDRIMNRQADKRFWQVITARRSPQCCCCCCCCVLQGGLTITRGEKAENNLTFGVRVKIATHMQLRRDDRVLSARPRLLERAISKDRFVCLSDRPGASTPFKQMLHEKSGGILANLGGIYLK